MHMWRYFLYSPCRWSCRCRHLLLWGLFSIRFGRLSFSVSSSCRRRPCKFWVSCCFSRRCHCRCRSSRVGGNIGGSGVGFFFSFCWSHLSSICLLHWFLTCSRTKKIFCWIQTNLIRILQALHADYVLGRCCIFVACSVFLLPRPSGMVVKPSLYWGRDRKQLRDFTCYFGIGKAAVDPGWPAAASLMLLL